MAIHPPLAGVLQTLEIFRATSGTSLAYSFVTFDATGENDDRSRHDGGTRGTSIPLGFKRHFRPLPPQIIPARVRGSWTILPSRIHFALDLQSQRRPITIVQSKSLSRAGKSICKSSRVAAS